MELKRRQRRRAEHRKMVDKKFIFVHTMILANKKWIHVNRISLFGILEFDCIGEFLTNQTQNGKRKTYRCCQNERHFRRVYEQFLSLLDCDLVYCQIMTPCTFLYLAGNWLEVWHLCNSSKTIRAICMRTAHLCYYIWF